MKSENKNLSNDISAVILGKLHGLNAKSAKKLVKAVDDCAKDIVKKFVKFQKNEEKDQEREAIKATKKLVVKAEKIAKAKEKAAEKAALNAKIALVTIEKTSSLTVPPPAPKVTKTPDKKNIAKTKSASEPVVLNVEPVTDSE